MAKKSGKIKSGGKITSRGTTRNRSQINAINVKTGIGAEDRVLNTIHSDFKPRRVTPNKTNPDKGIPDIEYFKAGKMVEVEVKSVSKWIFEGNKKVHGRAQFLKRELEYLVKNDGIIIIELRESPYKYRYFRASARRIYNLVKDEEGEEVKLEYNQILSLKEVKAENPLSLPKYSPSLRQRLDKLVKEKGKTDFYHSELRKVFTVKQINKMLYDGDLTVIRRTALGKQYRVL